MNVSEALIWAVWVEKECVQKKNLHMANMYHHIFALIYVQSIFNAHMLK